MNRNSDVTFGAEDLRTPDSRLTFTTAREAKDGRVPSEREDKRSAPAPARGESDTDKNRPPSRRVAIPSAVRQVVWFTEDIGSMTKVGN